ncbi:VWA domain-containing protein [Streptomyces turgidiscabies]|uniref:von Willebrand factor type A domain protein n=2 Tax=Streptomyces TaxID=1883 RepID=L7F014_STRT8|nr:VWA domain-containing protein [Streptomyces turgidiscabies]ELP64484.1 von Willebrand factor type A domain protein [Streptomyces turgidiscabies Car8]MDX3492319.1 VWA domain-containing protein [Streptomyces turgidiscabies]GAQ69389.1 Von Willebrand factor type A domain protein [Streptomyces turgidiscabies]
MGRVNGVRRTRRGRARRTALAVLGAAAVLISLSASPGRYSGRDVLPVAESEPAFPAVNYAVAVDESASLADADMAAEKAAAARIALGDVSSESRITVFGFAAAEGAGQSAVDPVCPRTTLDAAGRETAGACVGKLRKRKKGEGTGTDFPSAIRQGVHELTTDTDSSAPRVLFLLTDGIMEVDDSPQYGDPAHRKAEGERQLTLELANAAAQGVQIWPLGFGPKPDQKQLARIAAGGYQKGCVALPSARPKAEKVEGAKDVGTTLEKIFAAAHCMRHEAGPTAQRPPATMEIGISPLATVGSIVVDKGDPQVRITYTDPAGHEVPTSGTYRKSRFELAGGNGTVEALKIVDPLPGVWKVHAEAPEGHRSQPVAVSVLWQGELRGAVTMDPPSPRAGDQVTVTMRLQTREGYQIEDPRDYEGLRVRSELTGAGFDPLPLALADNGKGQDANASDGSFTGTTRIPASADGALNVSATLTAAGLSADTRSEGGLVAPGELPVTTALDLPAASSHPGGKVTGTLAVHNTSDAAHTLRLSVTDLKAGLLTVSPAELTLKAGESGTREVTVEIAPADVFGDRLTDDGLLLAGDVTVVDTTDDGRRLVRTPLSVEVKPKPGVWEEFWDDWWWAVLTGVVLIALSAAGVLALIRLRHTRRDPYGLVLRLLDEHGEPLPGEPHIAGHGHKQWYEFGVAEAHISPRIERRAHGPYAVRRNPNGGAVLRSRGGGRTPLSANSPARLTEGLSLALGEETRSARNSRNSRNWTGGSSSSGVPAGPPHGTDPDRQGGTSAYDDTYL